MKKELCKAMLYIAILTLLMIVGEAVFGQNKPNRRIITKTFKVDYTQAGAIDDAHESDDIIYESKNGVQYLNQTGTVADTLYTYYFTHPKKVLQQCHGITKQGVRCKNKQVDEYCRYHLDQQGTASN